MKKLLVVLLVLGFAATPALAANWHWYGNVRTHLGYYTSDEDFVPNAPQMDVTIGQSGSYGSNDDSGILLNVAGQSNIGAVVKVSDELSAHVEMGISNAGQTSGSDPYDAESVYIRGAYGKYKMGQVTLLMGKWYTPATFLGYSGMTADVGDNGDAIMITSVLPYAGRRTQLQISVAGFQAAFIEHEPRDSGALSLGPYTDADFMLPKIELAYQFNMPVFSIRPILGYQTFEVEDNANDESKTISSLLLGLGVNLRFGPAKVNLAYSHTTNYAAYGTKNVASVNIATVAGGTSMGSPTLIDDDVEDATLDTAALIVNFKASSMVSIEAGYGYLKAVKPFTADADAEQVSNIYYLNVPITVAPGLVITPEFGALDRGDLEIDDVPDDLKCGTLSWFSVRFAVAF